MKTIVLFFLILGLLWGAGVRVYPETLREYSEIFISRDYRSVEIRSGKIFIGEFVSENKEGVKIKIATGPILVPASSIVKTRQLVIHETFDALRKGELPGVPKQKPLEYLPSQNKLLPLIQDLRAKMNV